MPIRLKVSLDDVFSVRSNLAVLRALADSAGAMTGRAVAAAARLSPPGALDALARMEELGLVSRQVGGRTYFFTLNREHRLVQTALAGLLTSERNIRSEVIGLLNRHLRKRAKFGILFGSVARGQETSRSDLDIVIVSASRKNRLTETDLDGIRQTLRKSYGLRLSPILLSEPQFRAKLKQSRGMWKNLRRDGEILWGQPWGK
ncbi:nucleotidyltransferase domain-containing protein [bacterium]|nr:nucleotidyltransferase domain-containing protein [bacterium]